MRDPMEIKLAEAKVSLFLGRCGRQMTREQLGWLVLVRKMLMWAGGGEYAEFEEVLALLGEQYDEAVRLVRVK